MSNEWRKELPTVFANIEYLFPKGLRVLLRCPYCKQEVFWWADRLRYPPVDEEFEQMSVFCDNCEEELFIKLKVSLKAEYLIESPYLFEE